MRYDDLGLIVTDENDSGDSAHMTGLSIQATGFNPARAKLFVKDGRVVRHPRPAIPENWGIDFIPPWDNPRNGTRDQMSPIVGALAAFGYRKECRDIFWRTIKRLGFAQNIERDAPGTTKFPWPHYAHRQMDNPHLKKNWDHGWPRPLARVAYPVFKALRIVKQEHGGKWVLFDFADPLFPHYILAILVGGWPRFRPLARVLAYPFFVLDALTYRWSLNDDQGAIISCANVLHFIGLYKRLVPNWEAKCVAYFNPRGFEELGKDVIAWLKRSN
jgi:hypothetical protein